MSNSILGMYELNHEESMHSLNQPLINHFASMMSHCITTTFTTSFKTCCIEHFCIANQQKSEVQIINLQVYKEKMEFRETVVHKDHKEYKEVLD